MTPGTIRPFTLWPLRLGLALIFAYTGLEKLLETETNAAITAYAGLPWPRTTTVVLGIMELAIALAFLTGVATRAAAAAAAVFLVGVLVALKVPGPFWSDGWGIDVAVLAGCLTLLVNGPGRPTWSSILAEWRSPQST